MWRFFGAITGFIKDVLCYSASPKGRYGGGVRAVGAHV